MTRLGRIRFLSLITFMLALGILWPRAVAPCPAFAGLGGSAACESSGDEPDKGKSKSKKKKKKKKRKKSRKKSKKVIRWGQRRNESDAKYDKRFKRVIRKVKQDKRGDFKGGHFENTKGEKVRLWTYMGHPFIVRTDIDAQFTADTAMYMEMLHREYGQAYKKLLGIPASVKEKIEVIVFADRETYIKNGGSANSGGFFHPAVHGLDDRGPFWPARHYRLVQFTDGITEFAKWPKGTLKHEAAHMELQLRLGYTLYYGMKFGVPVDCPRWWNEGHATVFEYWDFEKSVEKNFAEIPNRGRYAPVIRRIHDSPKWKEFNYVWTIDPKSWHEDMSSEQGFLNYAQAWSLAAYMMHQGVQGRRDFRSIFDLSRRVGTDHQTTYMGHRKRAWDDKFPEEDQLKLEKNWNKWVGENVSRDKRVPDEVFFLRRMQYNPDTVDRLVKYTKEEWEDVEEDYDEEVERRKNSKGVER